MNRAEILAELQVILDDLSGIAVLSEEKKQNLFENQSLILITAIPFLAASATPRRDALTHVMTYLLSIQPDTKGYYLHTEADDVSILHRLRMITTISSGDPEIAQAGAALIARNMLEDYQRDSETDRIEGKYNPLTAGTWDYPSLARELEETYAPYRDLFQPILDPDTYITSFWEE